jgi:hypothetical protein
LSSKAQEGAAQREVAVLAAQNRDLAGQLKGTLRDNYEVAEYLRGQVLARDKQLAELHARLAKVPLPASPAAPTARMHAAATETLARPHGACFAPAALRRHVTAC